MKAGVTKQQFITKYAELLCMTRENVVDLKLVNDETVEIVYASQDGNECYKNVNIACDSGMAIIRDVARRIG